MVQAKPVVGVLAALILSLSLCSCNRANRDQSAQTSNAADQNAAGQQAPNASTDAANGTAQPAGQSPADNYQGNAPNQTVTTSEAPPTITVPAGTPITVRLQESLSSASARPGERFEAVVDEPVYVGDQIVIPVGAMATGHVIVARHSGRLRHPGELGLTLDTVTVGQQQVPLYTSHLVASGKSHKKRNWALIGGGTGGGALIGALAGGAKGGLIGGGIGAAAGTTTAFLSGKKNVTFGAERRIRFRLRNDVSIPENG